MFKISMDYDDTFEYFVSEDEVASEIVENLDDDVYDEMLDEVYGEIDICGLSYMASVALYRVDPIAYNCGRSDYYDSLYDDMVYTLERMDYGDTEYFYGYTVELIDDSEEEETA